jgi:hypothetical protein
LEGYVALGGRRHCLMFLFLDHGGDGTVRVGG